MANGLCDQCQATGLPLLPVRYAVVPKTVSPALPGWASGERVKDVALGDEFHYALRILREGYVYLFYEKNARGSNRWECYTVGQDGSLKLQPTPQMAQPQDTPVFQCGRHASNAQVHYLVIERPEKCATTWMAFSEHKWSDEALKQYAADAKLRSARMQALEPAALAKGAKHAHGAPADKAALEQVLEYAPGFIPARLPHEAVVQGISQSDGSFDASRLSGLSTRTPWHLRQGHAEDTARHMYARAKRADGSAATSQVLALWDAVGITHELNGFRNEAAGWLKKYASERELEITALNAIEGVKQALQDRAGQHQQQVFRVVMGEGEFQDIMRVKPNPRG